MKRIILLLALSTIMLASCGHRKHKHALVHVYKTVGNTVDALADNDWIFWYVINNNSGCYYTSSSAPLTSFSSVNWTRSESVPKELQEENVQEEQQQEVDVNELETEVQADIDADPANFEGTESDVADNGSDGSNDGGNDGGSDGGGDGGGGDGGGGDGGGGGGD